MKSSSNNKKIVLVFIACQLILAFLAFFNELVINNSNHNGIDEFDSFQEKIILALIIAPVFETLIFNLLLNEVFFKFINNASYCIILSSILFGLIHSYSIVYIFFTFLAGLVFNSFYFWIRKDKGYKLAALCVFLLHFNHNLIGVLLGK